MLRLPTSKKRVPNAVTAREKVKLAELERERLLLIQAKRKREAEKRNAEENKLSLAGVEGKHRAFAVAFPLRKFIYEAFPVLEPGYHFRSNWHIDAMAELLTAATLGEVKNFIINIPPRCMKSTLFCVMWFAWVWSFLPHTRWMFASYSEKFAKRDGSRCKILINSKYYQDRFGQKFKFTTPNTDGNFYNNQLGFRKAFGVKGGVGDGADFLMTDDPNRIDDYESEKMIDAVINWYINTYYNRVNDPVNAVRGNIQQRTGTEDLTGYILEKELGFVHLCLPMNWEDDHPYTNRISKPLKLGKVTDFDVAENPQLTVGEEKLWIDPRQKDAPMFQNKWYITFYKDSYLAKGGLSEGDGELLWKEHFTPDVITDLVKTVEVYGESAQLQQRPHPKGGTFFNTKFFPFVDVHKIPLDDLELIRYWDKAGSENTGDWTVGTLIARTKQRPYRFFILDIVRFQKSYYERMEEMLKVAKQDFENYILNRKDNDYTVGIEREGGSSGKDLSTIEKDALFEYDVWIDNKKVAKSLRAKVVRQRSEGGYIQVARNAIWNAVLLRRLARYNPRYQNQKDDEIDTLGGGIYFLAFLKKNKLPASHDDYL